MQAKERRQLGLLAALTLFLALVVWWQLRDVIPSGPAAPVTASRAAGSQVSTARPGRAGRPVDAGPVVVHLAWLAQPRAEPMTEQRDPFVFGATRAFSAPSPEGVGVPGGARTPVAAEGPPVPAPPPPIPYRFIGLLDAPGTGRVAVLSDGRFVYQGREGDIIDGRYRLVSVSTASVELEYLDGRGRQTLRLSGS